MYQKSKTQTTTKFIEHYGVMGMRWGKRKGSTTTSTDHKEAAAIRAKKTSQLTNKQLEKANKRSNLEMNFNRMNPGKAEKGRKVATEILATVGVGITAYNMVHSPAGKALISKGKKYIHSHT